MIYGVKGLRHDLYSVKGASYNSRNSGMPPIQQTVWPAEAHTLAKIEILKRYLEAWFHILGTTRKKDTLLFIDGFAGPGKYSAWRRGIPCRES